MISTVAFEDEAGKFLLMLAIGTFAMCFVGFFFLRVIPHSQSYIAVPNGRDRSLSASNRLVRTKSGDSKRSVNRIPQELGTQSVMTQENTSFPGDSPQDPKHHREASKVHESDSDETSSLLSPGPGDTSFGENESHRSDIRGFALLPTVVFWQLLLLLGILTGIGLMTIK